MRETTSASAGHDPAPIKISLPRYTFWFALFRITIPVATTLFFFLTGIVLSPYKLGITLWPAVLAALIVGRRFARLSGRTIEPTEARSFARSATLRFFVADLLISIGMPYLLGHPQNLLGFIDIMTSPQAVQLLGLIALPVVAAYFINRWCVVLAAKASLKLSTRTHAQEV